MARKRDIPAHCAKFSPPILQAIAEIVQAEAGVLQRTPELLDPFCGIGGIHAIHDVLGVDVHTRGIELQRKWAAAHPRTKVGDATKMKIDTGSIDIVATSVCYANRMSDTYDGSRDRCLDCKKAERVRPDCPTCGGTGLKPSKRMTYTISHGGPLEPNNAGAMQWGQTYRALHREFLVETARVLRARVGPKPDQDPGGLAIVNISNHIRDGVEQYVVEWFLTTMIELGYKFVAADPISTRRYKQGQNGKLRVDAEQLLVFRAPVLGQQTL